MCPLLPFVDKYCQLDPKQTTNRNSEFVPQEALIKRTHIKNLNISPKIKNIEKKFWENEHVINELFFSFSFFLCRGQKFQIQIKTYMFNLSGLIMYFIKNQIYSSLVIWYKHTFERKLENKGKKNVNFFGNQLVLGVLWVYIKRNSERPRWIK